MNMLGAAFIRNLSLPFTTRRHRTVVALESSGEYLKVAQVSSGPGEKRVLKLIARTVVLQEDLPKILAELVSEGLIPVESSVIVSIPRNLVTVRNLQLPTTDPQELKEMVNLQAVKQTPFLKDEIVADFQVVRSNPEGHTDVLLVTTHRSVANSGLKILDDAGLQAGPIHLSSQGILNTYDMIQGFAEEPEDAAVAIVDVDASYSDFIVLLGRVICFTKALSVGPAKQLLGGVKEIEKFTEEIQRAIDIYGNEGIGQKISKVVITGAEIDIDALVPKLSQSIHLPVERMRLLERIPEGPGIMDLSEDARRSISFASVLGLAWNPDGSLIDLTPQEVRLREALAQKGRAITSIGISSILILSAITGFVSQKFYSRKQYLEELTREVQQTQQEAGKVEAMKKKIRVIGNATGFENSSLEILSVLYKSLPSDIFLKSITFEDGSHLMLQGVAEKMSVVFGFLSTLEKQPNFHHVKTKHVTRTTKKGGREEINFEMTCLLTKHGEV